MSGMIKKTLCAASVGIGLSLAYFASATAPDDGEPPPPPALNDCSPGFWKNHPEIWATLYCNSETCVADVLEELTSRGPGSDARRHDQADDLNEWADRELQYLVCPS
jgi:hypothetical protein